MPRLLPARTLRSAKNPLNRRYTSRGNLWQPSAVPISLRASLLPLALSILSAGLAGGCGSGSSSGGNEQAGTTEQPPKDQSKTPPEPELTQDQLEELYRTVKTRIEATTQISDASFAEHERDLRKVAEKAEDKHLRANASMLLGSLFEERGDRRTAISFYRQAMAAVPEEPSPRAVLAMSLAADQQWKEAIEIQGEVVRMVPDDLQAWLLLGEMNVKAGDQDEALLAYTAYELRRKGLLDGLTLKKDGQYVLDEDQRAACADALAPAADNGTALALMYALDSDPSAKVRASVASVMGEQRLVGYKAFLEGKLASEADADAKAAIEWAIGEIQREPVETAPGALPEALAKQIEEAAKAQAAEAEVGLSQPPAAEGLASPPKEGEGAAAVQPEPEPEPKPEAPAPASPPKAG